MSDNFEPPFDPENLNTSELLRFLYSYPLGLVYTSRAGSIRILNGAATALLMPYCLDGLLDNLFDFVARWDAAAVAPMRELVDRPGAQTAVQRLRVHQRAAAAAEPADAGRWLEFYARAFEDGLLVACQDVTEAVTRERELVNMTREEAEQRGRAELAAGVLHDMGNALTGLGGHTVALRAVIDNDEVTANLDKLGQFLTGFGSELDPVVGRGKGVRLIELVRTLHRTSVDHRAQMQRALTALNTGLSMAQELLTISRMYASSAGVSAVADLRRMFGDLREITARSLHKRKGSLSVELPDPLPRLTCDRSKLLQILLNVLKNAQEAWDREPSEPLRIDVIVRVTDAGGVAIEVRDNGCGFSPDEAGRLFDRDFSSKARGSGLGLYSCRKLAESMGGELTLTSTGRAQGAVATLVLPPDVVYHGDDTRV